MNSNAGVMSSTTEGAIMMYRAMLSDAERMANEDHIVVPLKWNDQLHNPGRKLKIGW